MTLRVEANQPPFVPPAALVQPESSWKIVLKMVAQIALQVLIPFAAALLSYLLLPATALAVGLPAITICTAFAVAFLSIGQGTFPFGRADAALPAAAPRGIYNGVMNCWANSLAQTLCCDEGLTNWFLNLPDEWERIQQLPFLAPQFFMHIVEHDVEVPALVQEIYQNDEEPLYLEMMHLPLHVCIDEPNLNSIAIAKSYYRKYCGDFNGTDQEFIQHLQDPQFAANLYAEDRQKIQTYFQLVGEAPEASRYFHFFAEIPLEERLARKDALAAFQLFLRAYDQAQEANLPRIDFQSQRLRVALSHLNPRIDANASVQLDPMEALTAIGDLLTPRDLKVDVEARMVLAQGENPAMEGEAVIRKREGFQQLGYMQLPITGNHPNIQDMVDQAGDARNENPELLVRSRAVDGLVYEYLVEREQRQFIQAPKTLWLHVKRMANVKASSWECLQRLMPNWFSRSAISLQKIDTPITVQQELTIQSLAEGQVGYKLDSVIIHRGTSLNSGHYVSYKLVEIEPDNWAWFEMNDDRVRQLSDEEAQEYAEQGYAYHYSKI